MLLQVAEKVKRKRKGIIIIIKGYNANQSEHYLYMVQVTAVKDVCNAI